LDTLYRNIKSDIIEIQSELLKMEKKIHVQMLNTAYKLSASDEELAYNLGLWCNWIKETDAQLSFFLKDEMNRLQKNFIDNPAEDYFLLNKTLNRKFRYYFWGMLALGLFILYYGVFIQISGFQTYAMGYRLLPVIKNGLTIGFIGMLISIAAIVNLRDDIKRKKYYRLVK